MARRRRQWIERAGATPATTPMWTSRTGWIEAAAAWAASPDFVRVRASLGSDKPLSMTAATFGAVATVMAEFADHATGRNVAVTKAVIAARVGCSPETVKRAWRLLSAAGLAVKVREGHGSSSAPSVGNRAAVWHLVSRPAQTTEMSDSVTNVPLPPKAGVCCLSPVGNYSPSARQRAPGQSFHQQPRPRRRWRATPRPLAVQRLAGQLAARAHGLHRGHIGALCDAITTAGIDPARWTAQTVQAALDADMRATGRSWPARIDRPGAFLASRLRRLTVHPEDGGVAATSMEEQPVSMFPRSAADVHSDAPQLRASPEHRRALRVEFQRELNARRRPRSHRDHDHTAPEPTRPVPATVGAVGVCSSCGATEAPRRRFLPQRRAHMCDDCWGA